MANKRENFKHFLLLVCYQFQWRENMHSNKDLHYEAWSVPKSFLVVEDNERMQTNESCYKKCHKYWILIFMSVSRGTQKNHVAWNKRKAILDHKERPLHLCFCSLTPDLTSFLLQIIIILKFTRYYSFYSTCFSS